METTAMTTNSTSAAETLDNVKVRCVPCSFPDFDLPFNLILIGLVSLLGLAGNSISVFILQKERSNRVAVFLLQSLAVVDNACLLVSLIMVCFFMGLVPSMPTCEPWFFIASLYARQYIVPIGYMTQTGTIWTVVLLAANRYIAICRPFQAQSFLTLTRAKIQVACVFAFSVLFNLPRFFQLQIVYHPVTGQPVRINATSIGSTSTFGLVYTNALSTILVVILPFIILVILNVHLILVLRESRLKVRRNSVRQADNSDNNISFVMIIIIVIFIFCHLPDRIFILVQKIGNLYGCTEPIYYMQCLCNFLFAFNSSVNFLIYYFFRRRFRRIFKNKLCGWLPSVKRNNEQSAFEKTRLHSLRSSSMHRGSNKILDSDKRSPVHETALDGMLPVTMT